MGVGLPLRAGRGGGVRDGFDRRLGGCPARGVAVIWRDPIFDGIPLRRLVWWRVSGIVTRAFWRVVSIFSPRCPVCHQYVGGAMRMTPWGRCEDCEDRLWKLADNFGDRQW